MVVVVAVVTVTWRLLIATVHNCCNWLLVGWVVCLFALGLFVCPCCGCGFVGWLVVCCYWCCWLLLVVVDCCWLLLAIVDGGVAVVIVGRLDHPQIH